MNGSDQLLTMVLLTHNRVRFLARAIRYYSAMPYTLLIMDSSTESNAHLAAEYGNERTSYQHCGNYAYLDIIQKLRYATKLVKTSYMAFVTDDDFTLQSGLDQSLDFLEANPDYTVCHGYCMMYLADSERVHYFLRDKKVLEDYAGGREERIVALMDNYIPPFYAISRSEVVRDWYQMIPNDIGFEYNEFGESLYKLARGKARILQIPYVARELNYPASDHQTDLYTAMTHPSFEGPKKAAFFNFLVEIYRGIEPTASATHARILMMKAAGALARCLSSKKSLTAQKIFRSEWKSISSRPQWIFEPEQFVEMPFYNEEFFTWLEQIDLLLRAMPCGKLQLKELDPKLLEQGQLAAQGVALLNERDFKSAQQVFESILSKNPFHVESIYHLCALYLNIGQLPQAEALLSWAQRLEPKNPAVSALDSNVQAAKTDARSKAATQSPRIAVLCHLYFAEYWPSIAAQLLHLTQPFDLIVTASKDQQEEIIQQIDIDYPNAKLYLVDDREPHIWPLFKVMEYETLEDYDYLLKIHTPKPINGKNTDFIVGSTTIENLLPHGRMDNLLNVFDAHREFGLIGPAHGLRDTGHISGTEQENTVGIAHWAHRLGFSGTGFNYNFIHGDMFWIRGSVLRELRKLDVRMEDFESEPTQADESLTHIFAHVFALVTRKVGMSVAQLDGHV